VNEEAYKIAGIGTVVTGKVVTGILKERSKIMIAPIMRQCSVKAIQMFYNKIDEARPGDQVSFSVDGLTVKDI
jgi:translation elongation factor EF-1alpha